MAVYTGICGDDWMGIYRDDELVYQGHNIAWNDLLKLVEQTKVEYFGRYDCCLDWLDKIRWLPERLEDVHMNYRGKPMPFYEYLEKTGT